VKPGHPRRCGRRDQQKDVAASVRFMGPFRIEKEDAVVQTEQIKALHDKHAELETTIEEEENRPMPNSAVLQDLKRQKLAIKDQIADLEHT
jgi:hypothetical protein